MQPDRQASPSLASNDRAAAPAIDLRGISVSFGAVHALTDVDLSLPPGQRHAIVGENGAGKSTLMRVLFGLLAPDRGTIAIDDAPRRFSSPADAIALGIGMVHQHFELIPGFTVAENIVLGAEVGSPVYLDRRRAAREVADIAERSGLQVKPNALVESLSVAAQQRVEILKALYRNARVLILDEPTAVLAPAEAEELWAATARMSQAGVTVVFITHKLDEVMAHADHVTVLRHGKRVLDIPTVEATPTALANAMVGGSRPPSVAPPRERSAARATGAVLKVRSLSVRGHRGETAVDNVSFDLQAGEILGIAGVDGSGQQELIEALMGLRPTLKGTVSLLGREIQTLSPARRRAAGMGYIPEDRHHRAVILPFTIEENAILGRQRDPQFERRGVLDRDTMRRFLEERAAAFDVRGARVGLPVRSLSGGNQQKLVLARELSRLPSALLASQPSRGLDFAATAFVHDALRAERDRGGAVLVQSLDLDEVLTLSDRVAVMLRGRIAGILSRAEATAARVGALMTGAGAPP